jgi:hypothetical protein
MGLDEKPWRDVSYTIPHRSTARFKHCFEAPIDRNGVPQLTETMMWCEDQFGTEPGRWGYSSTDLIFVASDLDATIFKVRWC